MKFPFLKAGTGMSVDCLDMPPERGPERGPEHGAMYRDLIKVIFCHECRAAGRDDRDLQFTNLAVTPEKRWRG
ncbi:MAG: hypothetical protein E5V58_08475 [Mesorhizobium sp.]|nr:MAG: hypothetical protein E5V58_08475 [Mesorhizobium sp.]